MNDFINSNKLQVLLISKCLFLLPSFHDWQTCTMTLLTHWHELHLYISKHLLPLSMWQTTGISLPLPLCPLSNEVGTYTTIVHKHAYLSSHCLCDNGDGTCASLPLLTVFRNMTTTAPISHVAMAQAYPCFHCLRGNDVVVSSYLPRSDSNDV